MEYQQELRGVKYAMMLDSNTMIAMIERITILMSVFALQNQRSWMSRWMMKKNTNTCRSVSRDDGELRQREHTGAMQEESTG